MLGCRIPGCSWQSFVTCQRLVGKFVANSHVISHSHFYRKSVFLVCLAKLRKVYSSFLADMHPLLHFFWTEHVYVLVSRYLFFLFMCTFSARVSCNATICCHSDTVKMSALLCKCLRITRYSTVAHSSLCLSTSPAPIELVKFISPSCLSNIPSCRHLPVNVD